MGTKFGTSLVAAFHLIVSFNGFVLFLTLGLFLALDVGIPLTFIPDSCFHHNRNSYNFRDELAQYSAYVRKNPESFDIITTWLMQPVIGTYVVELVIWTIMVIFFLRIVINSALLKGVVSRKSGWIKFWLWVHVLEEILLNTPIKILVCIYIADKINPAIKIVPMVLSYLVEGLCLWIVYSTMRDLSPSTTKVSAIESNTEQPFAISNGQNGSNGPTTKPVANLTQLQQELQQQQQRQLQANAIHFQQQQPFFQHVPHPAGYQHQQPIVFQQPIQLPNQGQQQQQQQQTTKVVTDSDYVDEKRMEFIIKKLLVKTASENEAV